MRLRPAAPFAVLLLVLVGCSPDGNDSDSGTLDDGFEVVSETPSEVEEPEVEPEVSTVPGSEFTGRWKLIGYSLDDGTSRTVPDSASAQIAFGANEVLDVTADYCESFQVPYTVNDGVLTTTESITPEGLPMCDAIDGDDDSLERSALMYRALLNTQTMVAVSDDDVLTVTTGTNEVLLFDRVVDPSPVVGQWMLRSYSESEDGIGTEVDLEDRDSGVVLNLGPDGRSWLSFNCGGLEGFYSLDDEVLSFSMSDALVDGLCPPRNGTDEATVRLLLRTFGDGRLATGVADGVLTLATPEDSSPSASAAFEFVALEFGPDAKALVDRPWQLTRYIAPDGTLQDVLPEAVFQFRLEPDSSRAEAFDLCVDQDGSYEFGDGFVVIRLDGPVDGVFCAPDNPGLPPVS